MPIRVIEPPPTATGRIRIIEPAPASKPRRSMVDNVTGFMANVNRGLGIGDELAAAGKTARDVVTGRAPVQEVGNAFARNMREQRQIEDGFRAERPNLAALGQGTGMAVQSLAPMGQTANAFAQAPRALNMARGAVTASAAAAGAALVDRGTGAERLKAASEAARNPLVLGLGAAGGALAPAMRRSKAPLTDEQVTVNAFATKSKPDVIAARAKIEDMRSAGVEPTMLDVSGQGGRRLVRAVGVKGDAAGEILEQNSRMASAATKPSAMAATRRLVNEPRTATQLAGDLDTARSVEAVEKYGKFYDNEMVQVPDSIKDMLADSSGRSIISRARADAIENQDWGRQVELDKLMQTFKEGSGRELPMISAGTVDRLVIAARERGGKFAEMGRRSSARGALVRRDQLDAVLDKIDAVKPARAAYRAKSQAIDILNKPGVRQDIFSTDPADYATWLQSLPPEARHANQVAIRQEILDTLGGQRSSTFGSLDNLATSPYVADNLRAAIGPDADRYLAHLSARLEKTRNAGFVAPNAGARTAVLNDDMANKAGGAIQVGARVMTGDWRGAAVTGVVNWLKNRGISDVDAAKIAQIARSDDPAQLDRMITAIERRLGPKAGREVQQYITTVQQRLPGRAAARLSVGAGVAGAQASGPNAFAQPSNP